MKTTQAPVSPELRERPTPPLQPQLPAKRAASETDDLLLTVLPPLAGALVGVIILLAVGVMLAGQAGGLAALGAALLGQHSAWYMSRASAFAAYVLLWWSMVLGVSITNRLARLWPGGPTAGALHEHASLLGLAFGALHALVLLGDQYIGYTLPQILIPFAGTSYLPLWVGLGQIGFYLMALVTLSSYLRRWIGTRAWRSIHYLSFGMFVLALAHGLFSGSDSGAPWAICMYAGTGLSLLGLTVYRVLMPRKAGAPAAA